MKKLLALSLLLPTLSFADFNAIAVKPNVLEVKKYREVSGRLTVKHVHDNPRIVVSLGSTVKEVRDFISKVIESDIQKINCDGDFFPAYDMYGVQHIMINSIKTCVDESGDLIAHSVGMAKLNEAQISASKKVIADGLKPVTATAPLIVNDSNKPKEVDNSKAGFISPKLFSSNVPK